MWPIGQGWRCSRWSCRPRPDPEAQRRQDVSRIQAGIALVGALDGLRRTAADALEAISSEGQRGDVRAVVEGLERGVERVVHASAPVHDALRPWAGPRASSDRCPVCHAPSAALLGCAACGKPSQADKTAIELAACPRCGVFTSTPCDARACPLARRGAR